MGGVLMRFSFSTLRIRLALWIKRTEPVLQVQPLLWLQSCYVRGGQDRRGASFSDSIKLDSNYEHAKRRAQGSGPIILSSNADMDLKGSSDTVSIQPVLQETGPIYSSLSGTKLKREPHKQ